MRLITGKTSKGFWVLLVKAIQVLRNLSVEEYLENEAVERTYSSLLPCISLLSAERVSLS